MIKGPVVLYMVIALFAQSNIAEVNQRIITDNTLVVPGKGAEGILLGSNLGHVSRIFPNQRLSIVRSKRTKDVFADIFRSKCSIQLSFDTIYHYKNRNIIFFFLGNEVNAIAGLRKDRITIDAVDLRKGVGYFILTYGNESMEKIKGGSHTMYVYSKEGIAVVDDDGNDEIDMYLIFSSK